jgi:hypothetical protein
MEPGRGNDAVQTTAAPTPPPPQHCKAQRRLLAELGWGADYVVPRDFAGASASAMIANAEATRAAERFLHGEIVATERKLVPGTIVEITGTDPRLPVAIGSATAVTASPAQTA